MEAEILQRLCENRICWEAQYFCERGGIRFKLHHGLFVFNYNKNFAEGVKELAENAAKFYPDSEFATWWRSLPDNCPICNDEQNKEVKE